MKKSFIKVTNFYPWRLNGESERLSKRQGWKLQYEKTEDARYYFCNAVPSVIYGNFPYHS